MALWTLLAGVVVVLAAPTYERALAWFGERVIQLAETGDGSTRLRPVADGIRVRPADRRLPEAHISTLERFLAAPLVLGLLAAAGGGWRRRLGRLGWGAAVLFLVHAAGILVDAELRPLLRIGYRGPAYYVYRFGWWVLVVWPILVLPAATAMFVYWSDWRHPPAPAARRPRWRAPALGAALLGGMVLFAAALAALRPADLPEADTVGAEVDPLEDGGAAASARRAFREGRFADAERGYRDLLGAEPADPLARFNLGVALYRQGRFDEAVSELQRVRAVRPGFPGLDLALGAALLDGGRRPEALDAFRRADLSGAEDPGMLQRVGEILLEAGDREAAARAFRRLLAVRPEHPEALYQLGLLAIAAGRDDAAIDYLERATRARPDHLEAFNNLGVLHLRAGRTADALQAYRAAVALDPASLPAHFNLGMALVQAGHACEALAHFDRCLALPDRGGLHDRCRALLARLGPGCDPGRG